MRRLNFGDRRPRYETPRLSGVGSLDAVYGACQSGATATGHCSNGGTNTVGNDCASGSVNTGAGGCFAGSTNSGTLGCQSGSSASSGGCAAGSYPV